MSGEDSEDVLQLQQTETFEFDGVAYDISIKVEENMLLVHIESCDTADQWCGKYDGSYIEELTHKTGNYKQFNIFCNMLESALSQNSDSVSLNLLTYEDLKILREQKLGKVIKRKHKQDHNSTSKRYLIMTYSVEFDQIHYPLPLNYQTNNSKSYIHLKNRKFHNEKQGNPLYHNDNRYQSERDSITYEMLLHENRQLKNELNEFKQRFEETELLPESFAKELDVLKKIIKNLERELINEKSKHQRMMNKKIQEHKALINELEEIKASERNLKARCKNLTSELAILKKSARLSSYPSARSTTKRSTTKYSNNSNISNRGISPIVNRGRSRDRQSSQFDKSRGRSSSAGSYKRTPSPGFKRFDPSAYVKEKQRKEREASLNRSRRRSPSSSNRDRTPSYSRFSKPPSSENKSRGLSASRRNRRPSYGSDIESNSYTKFSNKRGNNVPSFKRYSSASEYSDEETYSVSKNGIRRNVIATSKRKNMKSAKKNNNDYVLNESKDAESSHSLGIAEIDARLDALQKFMKDNLD